MAVLEPSRQWKAGFLSEWPPILISLTLSGIGLVLIYSATSPMGEAGRSFVLRQMTWFSLGVVLMAIGVLFDYHLLERWGLWFFVFIIAALVTVWAVGKVTSGSRRWIDLGLLRFQPSEFAKLAVVIALARLLQDRGGKGLLEPRDLIRPLVVVIIPVVFVLIQQDLGTAAVIFFIAVSMVLFVGVDRSTLRWIGGFVLAAIPTLMLFGDRLLMAYQKKRLLTFFNPDYDPLGAGYHVIQSQIAIGSGGILGKGYLQGTQNQLSFLPVKHTDFIFSVLGEEWGFVGCAVVLGLFLALFLRGLGIAGKARDDFGALLAFGCTAIIFWHVTINVGMVMGLLPVVGVPLCFLSYGGSSLIASFLVISILVNVSLRKFSY